MSEYLNQMLDSIQLEEKGMKTYFVVGGHKFWFRKDRGMVRLRQVASLLLDASRQDHVGIVSGKYDDLFYKLVDRVIWQPKEQVEGKEETPIALSKLAYLEMLEAIEEEDEIVAMQLHDDFPQSLAVVALGKKVLGRLLNPLGTSTSVSSEETSGENTNESESPPQSLEDLSKPAQGFQPALREKSS